MPSPVPAVVKLPQGSVTFQKALGPEHAALMKALSSFAVASSAKDPALVRVNMGFVCEQCGKGLGEIVTLLGELKDAQVSVTTLRGESLAGLLDGALPLDGGIWELRLAPAGRWIFENARGALWW